MNQYFTSKELQRIEIEHFIFHIIVKDDDKPTHLDEVPLTDKQEKFFKDRFEEAGKHTTEYEFTDKENSTVVQGLKKMHENPATQFLKVSKELATSFHSYHKGNTKDGIMVIALVSLDVEKKLILILKMDSQTVLQYKIDRSDDTVKAILEEVTNPIVESKDALQKLAIIDITNHYEWDVLAFDSKKQDSARVGQYFENFLTMKIKETEVLLMETAIRTVRQWAVVHEKELDENQQIADYKERAIDYMESHDQFEVEAFKEYVIQDNNPERKESLKKSLHSQLENEGVSERNFEPKSEYLKDRERRHTIKTAEGVKIQWVGSPVENFIEFKKPSKETEELHQILIKTENIITLQ